jgi:hypothetical protein
LPLPCRDLNPTYTRLDGFEFRTERQAAEGVTILSHAVREKEMAMAKSKQFMQSPRIEVALLPDENGDIDNPSSLFDIWMILHVPDDKNPEGIRVDGGPYDRDDALQKLSEIWMEVGKKFAEVA